MTTGRINQVSIGKRAARQPELPRALPRPQGAALARDACALACAVNRVGLAAQSLRQLCCGVVSTAPLARRSTRSAGQRAPFHVVHLNVIPGTGSQGEGTATLHSAARVPRRRRALGAGSALLPHLNIPRASAGRVGKPGLCE